MKNLEKIAIGVMTVCFAGVIGINAQEQTPKPREKIIVGGTPIGVPPPPAGQVPPPILPKK